MSKENLNFMNFLAIAIFIIIAYFIFTITGGLFISVIGFLIDNFFLAFIGMIVLAFLFQKK